ncbi:MAG: HEAT repeat domain-containing protein [Bryobacteraceae bacterium]|jgi:HEAT repeat protein
MGSQAKELITLLKGGDRRSIGRVGEVVRIVNQAPERFRALIDGLFAEDEVVAMRCADAIEKISLQHPGWLQPHAKLFLKRAAASAQPEIRWHMAQIMPRLSFTPSERARAIDLLMRYLEDKSVFVRVSAMQALAEMSDGDPRLGKRIVPLIRETMDRGTAAIRARGRKLLIRFGERY